MSYIEGESRNQALLFPEILDDCIPQDNLIRFLDAFVEGLGLAELGFSHSVPETTGRPPYDPRDLLKLYLYGYLNGVRNCLGSDFYDSPILTSFFICPRSC